MIQFKKNPILPKRFALQIEPGEIILEYKNNKNGKLYHYNISIIHYFNQFNENLDYIRITNELQEKHKSFIGTLLIPSNQIIRLLKRFYTLYTNNKNDLNKMNNEIIQHIVEEEKTSHSIKNVQIDRLPLADYNKASEFQLKLAKERMEKVFNENAIKPDDPGYQYDKKVDFGLPIISSEWDEED